MKLLYANSIVSNETPSSAAAHLGLYCLSTCMSQNRKSGIYGLKPKPLRDICFILTVNPVFHFPTDGSMDTSILMKPLQKTR